MRAKTDAPMRRFNPLNDYLFYKVMGEKGDEVQLLGFINAVLGLAGEDRFASIEILENKTFTPEVIGDKTSIFDVRAVLQGSTKVNVEVQLCNRHDMDKRTLFYWSREYQKSLKAGKDYRELPNVIAINIVDFNFPDSRQYHTRFHLREDREPGLVLTESLEIHFINMVQYRKQGEKDVREDPLCRWLAWLNAGSPPELVEEVVRMDSAIQMADERMVYITGTEEEIDAYERRFKAMCDETNLYNSGVTDGLEQGRAEGRQEGITETTLEIAKKMKGRGRPCAEIAEVTGLSPEAVERL